MLKYMFSPCVSRPKTELLPLSASRGASLELWNNCRRTSHLRSVAPWLSLQDPPQRRGGDKPTKPRVVKSGTMA